MSILALLTDSLEQKLLREIRQKKDIVLNQKMDMVLSIVLFHTQKGITSHSFGQLICISDFIISPCINGYIVLLMQSWYLVSREAVPKGPLSVIF
jgi:hypothetical protein